jgi:hypothetical protein
MSTVFSSKKKIGTHDIEGVISVDKGGLGINSFQIGDLIYADGYQSLTKLHIEEDGNILTIKDGVPSWNTLEASFNIDHNNMLGLQGGNDNEKYHLTANEANNIINMEEKVRSIKLDGYISKDQIIIDIIRVGIKGKISPNSYGYLLPDYSESDEEVFTYIAVTNCRINKLMAVVRKSPGIGNSITLMIRINNEDTNLNTSIYDLLNASSNLSEVINVYSGNIISVKYTTSSECNAEDLQVIVQIVLQ